MLETLRDSRGEIRAVCEWYLVDGNGNFSPQGDCVWINQLEFSSSVNGDGRGYIRDFIKLITTKAPMAQWGYFHRGKYNNRIRMFSRKKWLKLLNKGD